MTTTKRYVLSGANYGKLKFKLGHSVQAPIRNLHACWRFGFSYRGCGNRALRIELIDAAEKG
jgi:hypothetical protein